MSFSQHTSITTFCQQYQLKLQKRQPLFKAERLPVFTVGQRLLDDMEEAKSFPMTTEKAKSEWIISPILKELKRQNPSISIFSGFALKPKGETNLQGNPDYILTAEANEFEIVAPIFCLMESKNKTPEEGITQCLAGMYAARLYNEQNEKLFDTMYGAVTNAFEWIFIKLEKDNVYVSDERYYLNDLAGILSAFQFIIHQFS